MNSLNQDSKYWYKFFYLECPVCGRGDVYRERQYTPKPEDHSERHKYEIAYDWCDAI